MKHTILIVSKESAEKAHIKSLPVPLKAGEKVIVCKDQHSLNGKYVKVKHGNPKVTSVFSIEHFTTLSGKKLTSVY
jgi:hypothetical protein